MKARVFKDLLIAQFWLVIVLGPGLSDSMAQEKDGLVEVRALLNPAVGAVPGERVEIEITVATPRWFTAGTRISLPEVPDLVLVPLLAFLLPQYVAEGKSHLTVAVGCTGGRHRSVAVVEELAARYADRDDIVLDVHHRDAGFND